MERTSKQQRPILYIEMQLVCSSVASSESMRAN
ncbi:MAG: hypothetical protein ACREBC_11250 [Pyrinomonadaceae bacterium]